MKLTTHAGIGWLLAEAGMADERFRRMVFLAAVLPDLDALPFLFGYAESHHVWTHNMVFSVLMSGVAAAYCRRYRGRAFGFTQAAFYSHYFGDYFFTQWPLALFWPFSTHEFVSRYACSYFASVNDTLEIASLLGIVLLAVVFKRTPLEVLSPRLDRLLASEIRNGVKGMLPDRRK